ncbi:MAG: transcription elongation factor GreA [Proteobacteria bacterium]|nr:transcription elongation factor GreA [Pseudomonadota bacterium]
MDRIPMTKDGYEALNRELEQLTSVERPQNIKAIEEARAHGDLSENAEFEAAKDRQGFIHARINELSSKIALAEIIDTENLDTTRVVFGCVLLLENVDTEQQVRYQLVGPDESDVKKGRISIMSPLGRAIIGKEAGEEIVVQTPIGRRCYELIDISCPT